MTDQWTAGSGTHDVPAKDDHPHHSGEFRGPWRSTGDRKIAGVAGGLGRAFRVDPILIRVAFVVLTIFGGFGGLLYVLGWLLLPADGDEVSAAQALLGRGRSSVAPAVTVGLAVVAVISALSMFSWGLPFLPLAIGGVILVAVMKRRPHRRRFGSHAWAEQGRQWHDQDWSELAGQWAEAVRSDARCSGRWSSRGYWPGSWGSTARTGRSSGGGYHGSGSRSGSHGSASSPFQQPAFWERSSPTGRANAPGPAAGPSNATHPGTTDARNDDSGAVDLTKRSQGARSALDESAAPAWPGPDGQPRTTPPAWDPLGVAPFAWDLPEPTELPPPTVTRTRDGGLSRVTLGLTLLVGATTAVGVFAGWWALTWAQVSGIALAVLALGLLLAAIRGRGYSLIGPGVFLSLVTLALAVTGLSGTSDYGAIHLTPRGDLSAHTTFSATAGELDVDLSKIALTKDRTIDVMLKAGHARVVIPAGRNVAATCSADIGHTDCLDNISDGVRQESIGSQNRDETGGRPGTEGTLTLNVHVNAGFAEVTHG